MKIRNTKCKTQQNMSMAIMNKTSIDELSFVQFIIALRQIKASYRAAELVG